MITAAPGWRNRALIVACLGLGIAAVAGGIQRAHSEQEDNGAREFTVMAAKMGGGFSLPSGSSGSEPADIRPLAGRQYVARLLDAEMERQGLPLNLRPTGQKIAQIESHHSCRATGPATKYGRALGPLQILPSSAAKLGYVGPSAALNSCGAGLTMGVRHMKDCVAQGYDTPNALALCHVQGPRYAVATSRYARSYVGLVANARLKAPVPSGAFKQRFAMIVVDRETTR